MASPQVVITPSNSTTPALGGLFAGLSFFLLQRLPQRSSFIDRIQANGGRIVKQENQATHIIADHYRHDCPAGSISYTFIEAALKDGVLPEPKAHAAGCSTAAPREAGSGHPGKSTRTPFTAEDDRVLWQWVEPRKRTGALVKGNEIYKQLEAVNGRHTWQAWRDHYLKKLVGKPPVGVEVTVSANPPPSPPTAQDEQVEIPVVDGTGEEGEQQEISTVGGIVEEVAPVEREEEVQEVVEVAEEFDEWELDLLLDQGHDIELIAPDQEDDAWDAWAQAYPQHSAQSWRRFWLEAAHPAFVKRTADQELDQERSGKEYHNPLVDRRIDENEPEAVRGSQLSTKETNSAMPVPPSSQKRKRTAYVEIPETTYGKKKHRSDNDEIFGRAESDEERSLNRGTADPSFPTSDMNRAAQEQLEQEGAAIQETVKSPDAHAEEEILDDAQAEAQAQFDEEVLGIARKPIKESSLRMSSLPTSDINHAASEQLRRESMDRLGEDEEDEGEDEDVEESGSELQTPSIRSQEEVEEEDDMVDETGTAQIPHPQHDDVVEISDDSEDDVEPIQSRSDVEITENILEVPGDRLTEANLASQQAQHKAQLLRGADLPEDDDAQDSQQQNEFLRYLQDITGPSDGVRAIPATTREPEAAVIGETRLREGDLPTSVFYPMDPVDTGEIPLPSQQEIDHALDSMIEWPSSPTAAHRREDLQLQSQSLGFETQVPYPSLPAQRRTASQHAQEEMVSSQPSMLPGVSYPSLPNFDEQRSSQAARSSPRSQASATDKWSRAEDIALLRGMKLELSCPQIIKRYKLERSESALRNRKKTLLRTFKGGNVPLGHEYYAEVERSPSPRRRAAPLVSDSATSQQSIGSQREQDEDDRSVASDENVSVSYHEAAGGEDEIDLTLAPPGGGWSSSPAEAVSPLQATPTASQQPQRGIIEPQRASTRDVVEVSSTSPSSSSSSSSSREDSEAPSPSRHAIASRRQALETQDILDAETQQPDLSIPLPPDSDGDPDQLSSDFELPPPPASDDGLDNGSSHHSPSPPQPNTPQSQRALAETQTLPDSDVGAYIDTMVVRGFNESSVIAALKATSLRPELAVWVLQHDRAGKDLPADVAGVWTAEEDLLLEGGNAKALRRLEAKHGWRELEGRLKFLEEWREGSEDGDENDDE